MIKGTIKNKGVKKEGHLLLGALKNLDRRLDQSIKIE
jgi:hypothetical protein